jgi:hypothetical protein
MGEAALSRPARVLLCLEQRSARAWFLPGVGIFPFLDYVLPFLPNQILLAGLSMTLPRRWVALAGTFAVATAAGAAMITAVIQLYGLPLVVQVVGNIPEASALRSAMELIRTHGLPALCTLAMLPWPPRTAVLACAVAGLPPAHVGLAVLAGRVLPASICAGLGAKAPQMLRRIDRIDRIMFEVEAEKRRAAA